MTIAQLAQLTATPIAVWFKRRALTAELFAAAAAAKYFAEQEHAAQLGAAWAHKRQALLNSALNELR